MLVLGGEFLLRQVGVSERDDTLNRRGWPVLFSESGISWNGGSSGGRLRLPYNIFIHDAADVTDGAPAQGEIFFIDLLRINDLK